MGKFPSPGFVLCASVWHGVAAQNEGDPRREMEKSFCSQRSPRTPASGLRAHLPSAPNLQDLFQLLLCVDHDDVGAAVVGDVLAGLRGARGVDAGDNAAVGDPGFTREPAQTATPSARNPAPGRGRTQTDGGEAGAWWVEGNAEGSSEGPWGEMGAGGAWGALRREIDPLSPSALHRPTGHRAPPPTTHPANTAPTAEKNHSGELKPRMATLCACCRPSCGTEADRPGQRTREGSPLPHQAAFQTAGTTLPAHGMGECRGALAAPTRHSSQPGPS